MNQFGIQVNKVYNIRSDKYIDINSGFKIFFWAVIFAFSGSLGIETKKKNSKPVAVVHFLVPSLLGQPLSSPTAYFWSDFQRRCIGDSNTTLC
ncbi:hypothetical protein Hanom_Chr14g01323241 [Helianthus anomalus]